MLEDDSVPLRKRREAEGFIRQSVFYIFLSPGTIANCFPEDPFQSSTSSIEVVRALQRLFDRGFGTDIVDALWKGVGELFPTVQEVVVENKKRKVVKPTIWNASVAAKVWITTLQVITAASPVASAEVWDVVRRKRSRGLVSLEVPFEDDSVIRLVERFVRGWYAYGLFDGSVKGVVRGYLMRFAELEGKERKSVLEKELGAGLAADILGAGPAAGNGGGWGMGVCCLEWVRSVMLGEWDGGEKLKVGGVVDGAVGFLKFLCMTFFSKNILIVF